MNSEARMRQVVALAALGGALAAGAAEVTVTNAVTQTAQEATTFVGDAYVSATPYPYAAVGNPAFWLDASDRTGWEYGAKSALRVTKIPSKVGARYLSQTSESYAPELDLAPTGFKLANAACLDFGAFEQFGRCMKFDAVSDYEGAVASNTLRRIGTIIAVYDSSAGGGYLMGQGVYSDGLFPRRVDGYAWCRQTNGDNPYNAVIHPTNPFNTCSAMMVRHDGILTYGQSVGFRGDWEVLSAILGDASAESHGLGLGDTRSNGYVGARGGFKVAEMLIFDKKLTEDQCALVEDYLNAKWYGRKVFGVNGNANLANLYVFYSSYGTDAYTEGLPVTFNTAAGKKLTVQRIFAGHRGGSSITKTGEGTIEFGSVENVSAPFYLAGGTLSFDRRDIPTQPVGKPEFDFDLSDSANYDTETVEGKTYVKTWRNTGSWRTKGTAYADRDYAALRQDASVTRLPTLVTNVLAGGKATLDFGPFDTTTGARLSLYTNDTVDVSTISRVSTSLVNYFAVLAPCYDGNGCTVSGPAGDTGNNFRHGSGYQSVIAQPYTVAQKYGTYWDYDYSRTVPAEVWINGVRRTEMGYFNGAYQVLSVQRTADKFGGVMQYGTYSGGGMLSELIVCRHLLSEEETRDMHAYLMKKWLNQRAPGYKRFDNSGTPDVQDLRVTAASTIYVGAGDTIVIGKLTQTAPLVKTGAGTLKVNAYTGNHQTLRIDGGSVVYAQKPDPTALAQVAANPSFHLDATDAASMTLSQEGGTNFVWRWYDKNLKNYAASGSYLGTSRHRQVWLNEDKDALLNGHPTVDFGIFAPQKPTSTSPSATMSFGSPLYSMRSVFIVRGSQGGCGWLMGNTAITDGPSQGACWPFYPNLNSARNTVLNYVSSGSTGKSVYYGLWVNGENVTGAAAPSGGYDLIELHMPYGEASNGFCGDAANGGQYGGYRIGEIIVYERELSDREKIATRNYLMKKWFGKTDEELTPLPAKPDEPTGEIQPTLVVVDGETAIAPSGSWTNVTIQGAGTLVKNGAGNLQVKDLLSFTGTLEVATGTLKVTGRSVPVAGVLKETGRLAHFDANEGVLLSQSGNVTGWVSRVGQTMAYATDSLGVKRLDYDLNSMPSIRMNAGYMVFRDFEGNKKLVTGIKTVLWMIGSQEGGGFVLGGGGAGYQWHRARIDSTMDPGQRAEDPIMSQSADDFIENGYWRKNGAVIAPKTTGLSGAWDQLTFRNDPTLSETGGEAEGFAHDSRSGVIRRGHQRLAEIVLYDHELTDEEILAGESYLSAKWGVYDAVPYGTNNVALALAAGTTLDLSGTTQYVAAVTGAGTVTNGALRTLALACDLADPELLTVTDGAFVFAPGFSVCVTGDPSLLPADGLRLVATTSFDGLENFSRKAVTGSAANRSSLALRPDGLYLRATRGLAILIR